MKKIISMLLVFTVCLSLCACGSNNDNNSSTDKKNNKSTDLVLTETNNIDGYVDFSLFKISTSKKITGSMYGNGSYYENDNAGETYIDVVLDITNKSDQAIMSDDILVASATNSSGTIYNRCLYAAETRNGTSLSTYESVAPFSTVRLHCGISVPETETDLTIMLNVNGKNYSYNYSMGEIESNAKELKTGDTVEDVDYAKLVFNGIEYTDDLLPSNTSGSYNHYAVDNNDNTYLVCKFDITNYMSGTKDCDSFVGVKAMYMNKYTYTGFVVAEEDDGKRLSPYESIDPLTTRHLYYLIEVPKTVAENEVDLTLSFNGEEYTYRGK